MFKPVNVTVGTDATLLLPAATPKAADVSDWVAETALAVGTLVKTSAGRIFWCVTAGDTGTTEPTHADGDATNGTAVLRAHRACRQYLAVVNHGAVAVFLGIGETAELDKGIRLNANGGSYEPERVPQGKIQAIAASGTAVVGIQEGG